MSWGVEQYTYFTVWPPKKDARVTTLGHGIYYVVRFRESLAVTWFGPKIGTESRRLTARDFRSGFSYCDVPFVSQPLFLSVTHLLIAHEFPSAAAALCPWFYPLSNA